MTTFAKKFAPAFQVATVAMPLPAALADLDPLDLTHGTPAARWTATRGESEMAFRARITEDLAATGPHGALVMVYENGDTWVRRGG
ncbi:MAG: hypothetical protein B7Z58_01810 [Acidiphilium sp. 37-64-53]|uniref:hypothetical protein n=2 Tax=Acidocellaceae TaxID=3385905 RepID=UPI000BCF3773|nr:MULTISPECIES: hypothetical protein [Acidiphilium]OYW03932.1 MAG: hypothetical protein B7Z58_01810 [Acidiphilium sp. 37-64-53]HQT83865.1 hypothetical protein [Acidiphilium rubrum]